MSFTLELPDIGEGIVEAEIQKWFVKVGDEVAEDQPLVEVMTDKATVTIPSPRRGRITRLFGEEGGTAKVHAPLVELALEGGAGAPSTTGSLREPYARDERAQDPAPAPEAAAGAEAGGRKALAAPAVRAMARELGIDLGAIRGSGPDGRVTKEDLERERNGPSTPGSPGEPQARDERTLAPASARVDPAPARVAMVPPAADERIPLKGVRKRIAENMARSKRTAAHFTFVEQCDATELVRLKARLAGEASAEGVRLTYLPFIVKATVLALQRFPQLNAALDEERGEIVRKGRYDIGIAAQTDAGLTVPVVRGADRRSILDLARELERLANDAKAGRARPEDMGNSTFTITSLGALGGVFATPVLNHPEVGILGIHRIRPTPVVKDGQIVARDVMHVSVTSDHRVVDGEEAARFAYEVIRTLEDPERLLLRLV